MIINYIFINTLLKKPWSAASFKSFIVSFYLLSSSIKLKIYFLPSSSNGFPFNVIYYYWYLIYFTIFSVKLLIKLSKSSWYPSDSLYTWIKALNTILYLVSIPSVFAVVKISDYFYLINKVIFANKTYYINFFGSRVLK